jgi:hypothetical protein
MPIARVRHTGSDLQVENLSGSEIGITLFGYASAFKRGLPCYVDLKPETPECIGREIVVYDSGPGVKLEANCEVTL